jgi:hypothetical protein
MNCCLPAIDPGLVADEAPPTSGRLRFIAREAPPTGDRPRFIGHEAPPTVDRPRFVGDEASSIAHRMHFVGAEKAKIADTKDYVSSLEQLVRSMFTKSVETLADFGLTPRKQVNPKTDATALKIARAKATRVARGTVGPKQKAKIKGVVPAPPHPIPPAATAPTAPAVTKPDAGNGGQHA